MRSIKGCLPTKDNSCLKRENRPTTTLVGKMAEATTTTMRQEVYRPNMQQTTVNIDNNVVSHENKGPQGTDRADTTGEDKRFKEETSVVL